MKRTRYLVVCFSLVFFLLYSSISMAVTSSKKIDVWKKYDPPITISTVYGIDDWSGKMPKGQSFEGANPFSTGYKEELGIKLKVLWTIPQIQYNQKVAITIASNELPDIMQVDAIQLNKLVNAGMVEDLTKVYKDYITP